MTLFDFSQSIRNLNQENRFSEALSFFRENKTPFTPDQIRSNPYLVSAMIKALRKTNNLIPAFKFLKTYNIEINENTNEQILVQYGWLLYDKYKSENKLKDIELIDDFDDEEFENNDNQTVISKSETVVLIEQFLPLITRYDNVYAYSVLSKLFNIIPKVEKKKANANWKLVNEICNLILPEKLKTDCETREVPRKGQMVQMEYASDRENWYAYKTKALFKTQQYQECLEVSKKALEAFEKFHYSNESWFARRIALSKKHLGNPEDVLNELLQVLKRKKEWFIQTEIAEIYKENGDFDKAFKYAIEAINNFGDLEYKVGLLVLIAEILEKKEEKELAFKHYSLSKLLRQQEEWRVPQTIEYALQNLGFAQISLEQLPNLKKELKNYWNTFKPQQTRPTANRNTTNSNQQHTGKIDKILHNDEKGANGFIKYDNNKSVYFRLNATDELIKKLTVGLEVTFKILPPKEDGKKERAIQLKTT